MLEYNIHVPPVPEGKNNALSFVCLRLTTYPKTGCNIPEHLQRRFLEVFAVQVQQFKGYMFQTCLDSLREVCSLMLLLPCHAMICAYFLLMIKLMLFNMTLSALSTEGDCVCLSCVWISFLHLFFQGIWTAVFSSCMDALRFAHAAQLLLMHTQWPTDARPFCGEALPGADGRWVFQGPRVCMAIHDSADYFVSPGVTPAPS